MSHFVLLLRGVGGRTQLDLHLLKALLRAEGFEGVRVHGHTGNAVLQSDLSPEEVTRRAGAALIREAGFYNGLQVVPAADWAAMVDGNPFPDAAATPSTLHLGVLGAEPDPRRIAAIRRLGDGRDSLEVRGRAVYLHVPAGFSRSRMAGRFDRGIGVPVTSRSWNTVLALLALLEAPPHPARRQAVPAEAPPAEAAPA
jgi:uncharacterized protein (DUF1697 family)